MSHYSPSHHRVPKKSQIFEFFLLSKDRFWTSMELFWLKWCPRKNVWGTVEEILWLFCCDICKKNQLYSTPFEPRDCRIEYSFSPKYCSPWSGWECLMSFEHLFDEISDLKLTWYYSDETTFGQLSINFPASCYSGALFCCDLTSCFWWIPILLSLIVFCWHGAEVVVI